MSTIRIYKEHDSYANGPTWDTALAWSTSQDASKLLQKAIKNHPKEEQEQIIKDTVTKALKTLLTTGRYPIDTPYLLLRDLLTHQVGACNWTRITNTLQGNPDEGAGVLDGFDNTIIAILQQQGWKDIVKDCKYEFEKDDTLRDWLWNLMETWTDNLPARPSALTTLAMDFFNEAISVVNWKDVLDEMRLD